MSLRIFVPDDIVADNEIPRLVAGVEIPTMGVRLGWMWTHDGRYQSFDGVVEWSRVDPLNNLLETVLVTSTFRALTQDRAKGPIPEVGDKLALRGTLSCVRSYEFEAFDLPDIRQSWRVTAILSQGPGGYMIEAVPIL